MRIYVLSRDPEVSAAFHVDEDVLQRCLGMAQVLCSVHRNHDALKFNPSKGEWQTAQGRKVYAPLDNDPFIEWAGATAGNYAWARRNLRGFLQEYQHRWGDVNGNRHKSWDVYEALREPPQRLRADWLYQPEAMSAFVTLPAPGYLVGDWEDVVDIHRRMYRDARLKKYPIPAYKNRDIPSFIRPN